jgi:hypothetical protein
MAKTLDDNDKRRQFLLNVGQTVFLEGRNGSARNPLKKVLPVTKFANEAIINTFMNSHSMILDDQDLAAMSLKEHKVKGEMPSGTHGIVISHFWTEVKYKVKNEKDEEEEKVAADTFCLLMVGEDLILVPFNSVNVVYGK